MVSDFLADSDALRTEIQQKTFESIRSGAEVVARAKTGGREWAAVKTARGELSIWLLPGSGKTLSFLLPCLDRPVLLMKLHRGCMLAVED